VAVLVVCVGRWPLRGARLPDLPAFLASGRVLRPVVVDPLRRISRSLRARPPPRRWRRPEAAPPPARGGGYRTAAGRAGH